MNAIVSLEEMDIVVDLEGLIDVDAERKRLNKELDRLRKSIVGKQGKLANEKFVANAPAEIVQREREGLDKLREQLQGVEASLQILPD